MSWYVVEGTGEAAYRWTRQPEVTWRLRSEPLPPCRLTIRIPLKNEVQPGFADACRLEIGGRSVPLKRVSGVLIASTTLQERTDSAVKLIMPPLLRPSDLGPVNDDRTLGLAISIKFVGR
jgi:hypothetical protein